MLPVAIIRYASAHLVRIQQITVAPIRITYVIPTLDQSGAERQLTLLAKNLPKPDYDVNVIALNRGGFFQQELEAAGIRVDILQKRFRFDPLTFVRLRKLLKSQQPDVVQSFLFSANSYIRFPGVCPAGAKIVVSERCVDTWKSGWQLSMDRRLRSRMTAMTANSESVAEFYRTAVGVDAERIAVIPNGIPQPTEPSETPTGLREELGLAENSKLVGFVGRLAPQKCLKDLIWAFQLLHQVVDDVFLVLAGDGPERDRLAEFATSVGCRDKVFFLGHRNDAADVIRQLNLFCLPSSFEGMSNSLMEAMSSGVPVVVSDIPANLELVTHEETGLTFPLGKSPEMTRTMARILNDSDLAERLQKSAAEKMKTKHSVEQLVSRHIELYERLTTEN